MCEMGDDNICPPRSLSELRDCLKALKLGSREWSEGAREGGGTEEGRDDGGLERG